MNYQQKSKEITLLLLTSKQYQASRSIHIYNSLKSEPDTQYIINHAKKSSRDIYYPEIDPYHNKTVIDVAIVPGTLFDMHMTRKGRGGGYYDRFLSITRAIKIGFALETENGENNALDKLKSKFLDYIILNFANEEDAGCESDTNHVFIYSKNGHKKEFAKDTKRRLSEKIISYIASNE